MKRFVIAFTVLMIVGSSLATADAGLFGKRCKRRSCGKRKCQPVSTCCEAAPVDACGCEAAPVDSCGCGSVEEIEAVSCEGSSGAVVVPTSECGCGGAVAPIESTMMAPASADVVTEGVIIEDGVTTDAVIEGDVVPAGDVPVEAPAVEESAVPEAPSEEA